ncbi:hypothetical protein [Halobellus ruber]|uniref:Uncharacterized protein n=1 Tax=Halobellus ruber TaxID=2761102 RepID=A0A7J9SL08_9EURY|nr:hypothetical protein [Halobellus ruber]MBB6646799.1 hypothetical protein [Halobellus ruber]
MLDDTLQYIVATLLIGGGIVGVLADLVGVETVPPAYFAVAIGAGSAAMPGSWSPVCWVRSQLSALRP